MKFFCSLCIALLCLSGCKSAPAPQEPSYPITIGEAIQKDTPVFIETIGNIYTLSIVQVRPQVGGIVLKAYVDQGQYVKAGDPLFMIDPRPYQAQLDSAKGTLIRDQATLEFSQIRLIRYKDLVSKDYFAKINYEQFVTEAESAKGQVLIDVASVDLAEINLGWCTPLSPIDGKISQYNIYPGNLVIANDPNFLVDIRQIDPADVRFTVNQKDFVKVQEAMQKGLLKFEVILPQKTQQPRKGKIYFVDNHIDLTTGTILIKGTVPNADEFFWPGEFVRVRLELKVLPEAILVPEEAVQIGQAGPFVYVYNPETSRVKYRPVAKGEHSNNMIVIENGIAKGEKVVLKGQINLKPDAKVFLAESS